MSASPESRQLERIEKLLEYVVYILIFEAALTFGLLYQMQQLVMWTIP